MSNNQNNITAYPLCWPHLKSRTKHQENSNLGTTFAKARDGLIKQVNILGGKKLIISTNIALRQDGIPYANLPEPKDTGVAIYFIYKNQQMCFACDRWKKTTSNMQAIRKTIEALRGIARWGSGDMMEAAFTGFAALPNPNTPKTWREILGLKDNATLADAEKNYKQLRSKHHPDKGGNSEIFNAIQKAWEQAKQVLNN